MLTKLYIENFKKLDRAEMDLDSTVVLVGPGNSGKTSALQAITLWELGLRRWAAKDKISKAKERVAATISRKDILAVPTASVLQLWHGQHARKAKEERNRTENILIKIAVEGNTCGRSWKLGLEFDYANSESIYCRLIKDPEMRGRPEVPEEALSEVLRYLPTASGLALEEDRLARGSMQRLIGEGRAAQLVRNLCLLVSEENPGKWPEVYRIAREYFGIRLDRPEYHPANGQISLSYRDTRGSRLDLSNAGRGFQQILLLFSYVYANPCSVLLLDEPDAHLETVRQRELFHLLQQTTHQEGTQLILATHSEALLSAAAGKARIIGFLEKPQPIRDTLQFIKSLGSIGYDQYLQARQKRWVLYIQEGTDLRVLQAFARVLHHPVEPFLENVFCKTVGQEPSEARDHFFGLQEDVRDLKGIALFGNRVEKALPNHSSLVELVWQRYGVENYLPLPAVLYRYMEKEPVNLFTKARQDSLRRMVETCMPPIALKNPNDDWWVHTRIADDFLNKVLAECSLQPETFSGDKYYQLALLSMPEEISPEVPEKLDAIYAVAVSAGHSK